jgi:hypothetical protein
MFAKLVHTFEKCYFFLALKNQREFGPSVPEGPRDGVEGEQHARPHRRPLSCSCHPKGSQQLTKAAAAVQLSHADDAKIFNNKQSLDEPSLLSSERYTCYYCGLPSLKAPVFGSLCHF